MVPSGLRQRISTSAPRSRPERMSTIGWKYGTNSPASSARSISSIGLSRSRLGSSTEIARMKIARSPLATVPNARRSPWLAAQPGQRCRYRRMDRVAAGGQIGDDDIVVVRRRLRLPRRSTAPPMVSILRMKAQRPPRWRHLRHEQLGGNQRRNAVARAGAGTANAQPLLRLRAEPHHFQQIAAAGRQRLGGYDLALLRLVADVRAQRAAIGRDDRQFLDRDRTERRLAQRVDIGEAAGIDAARGQFVERRDRARDPRLPPAPCDAAPTRSSSLRPCRSTRPPSQMFSAATGGPARTTPMAIATSNLRLGDT